MTSSRAWRPSAALVVAVIALIVALGGTSYAAFTLPKNSVGTKQLSNSAVTLAKISRSARASLTGSKGSPGAPGLPGPPGAPGAPGAPGSAIAYAHVLSDGTLDVANSKNVTAASLDPAGPYYCLTVAGTVHNVMVTPGAAPAIAGSQAASVYVDLSHFATCPAGTNVRVYMEKQDLTGEAQWPFYIAIN
jgi:hypothetical protein